MTESFHIISGLSLSCRSDRRRGSCLMRFGYSGEITSKFGSNREPIDFKDQSSGHVTAVTTTLHIGTVIWHVVSSVTSLRFEFRRVQDISRSECKIHFRMLYTYITRIMFDSLSWPNGLIWVKLCLEWRYYLSEAIHSVTPYYTHRMTEWPGPE